MNPLLSSYADYENIIAEEAKNNQYKKNLPVFRRRSIYLLNNNVCSNFAVGKYHHPNKPDSFRTSVARTRLN